MTKKPRDCFRDPESGQYSYWNDFERMCECGHRLGVHAAGGFDCLNHDRRNIYGPNDAEYHEADCAPCNCRKFRPVKRRKSSASQSSAALEAKERAGS